ncbi:siderophore ABC transporter substrate-binding protein [Alteribacillus iranensis]|uniref:Iron complex transport system substrate-binding protein n=1 Tax=Alteribacillus iranensis TaxID=930128 RepID=A0A1I2B6E0_9BACI|nr:siderophore ABC transporter substrate-binding protein [Alteribacillus iranensis]SFE51725.1 iron complex transport system substrate-binding protein [Alteribacillus iranensis]
MKKFRNVAGMLLMALTVSACGAGGEEEGSTEASGSSNGSEGGNNEAAEEIVIEHQLGETTVEANPEEVVVFDFGSLDTLDTLGVDVAGVPQANIPSYLEEYESSDYENVGGLKEPDFEKIANMAPDLIIISGRQQDAYEEFSKIAPTVFLEVDTQDYMNSFEENVTTLAKIFEKEAEAEEHLAEVKADVEALNEKVSAKDEEALIVLANDGKVSAYGSGSRFGIIHDEFGFPESDENIEASTHGQSVSFEYIAEQDPDYLFVIDRGAVVGGQSSAQQVVENELTEKTKAYQNDRIIYLNPDFWYLSGGGFVSVSEMVKEVESVIEG